MELLGQFLAQPSPKSDLKLFVTIVTKWNFPPRCFRKWHLDPKVYFWSFESETFCHHWYKCHFPPRCFRKWHLDQIISFYIFQKKNFWDGWAKNWPKSPIISYETIYNRFGQVSFSTTLFQEVTFGPNYFILHISKKKLLGKVEPKIYQKVRCFIPLTVSPSGNFN